MIVPSIVARKRTPTSIAVASASAGLAGTALPKIVHGQVRASTISEDVTGLLNLALSSVARTLSAKVPGAFGVNAYDQVTLDAAAANCAGCQLDPPSVDTSTPATTPPPASVAVPVTVYGCPTTPCAVEVTRTAGASVSVLAEAVTRPLIRLFGRTPMSANRFTVACCIAGLAVVDGPSCTASSP